MPVRSPRTTKLVIDGQLVIKDTRESNIGKMRLNQDRHEIEIFYEEDELEAAITLYWSSETREKKVMNSFEVGDLVYQPGLYAVYSCEKPTVCYTQSEDALYAIALEYPEDQLVLEIDKPNDDMKVTLLGCPKTLPWKFENCQLVIDTRSLKHSDLKSSAAWVFKMK